MKEDEIVAEGVQSVYKELDMLDQQEEEAEKKKKLRKKPAAEPLSIEKNVKKYKRNAEKVKDTDYEYNKPVTDLAKAPGNAKKVHPLRFNIKTWLTLDKNVQQHYALWFEEHKDKEEE